MLQYALYVLQCILRFIETVCLKVLYMVEGHIAVHSVHVAVVVLFLETLKDLFISDLLLEHSKLKTFEQVLHFISPYILSLVMCCNHFRDLSDVFSWLWLFAIFGSDVGFCGCA